MNTFDVNHFKVENNKYLFEHSVWFSLLWLCAFDIFSATSPCVWSENSLIDESVGDFKYENENTEKSDANSSFRAKLIEIKMRLMFGNWRNLALIT